MSLVALALSALLAQAEPTTEAVPAPVTAPVADQAPANTVLRSTRTASPAEMSRQLDRIRRLPPSEMGEAMEEFRRKFPSAGNPNPKAPTAPAEPASEEKVLALTDAEQVRYYARAAFNNIISGDARGLVLGAGYPFQLEDRKLEMPDELHKEWLKNLRSKRTDLLTLYDIEVLTPAEMEKKYGRPPARLNGMPWKNAHTLIAVGNLSGHAAIAVFRSSEGAWQMVGYHD